MILKMINYIYRALYSILQSYFFEKFKKQYDVKTDNSVMLEKPREFTKKDKLSFPLPFQVSFKKLNSAIYNYGCYFLSILFLASVFKQSKSKSCNNLDIFEVKQIFLGLASSGGIKSTNSFIQDPQILLNELGASDLKFIPSFKSPDYIPAKDEFLIGQFKNGSMYHFVVLDSRKEIIFDSLILSGAAKKSNLKSLRVFKLSNDSYLADFKQSLKDMQKEFLKIQNLNK